MWATHLKILAQIDFCEKLVKFKLPMFEKILRIFEQHFNCEDALKKHQKQNEIKFWKQILNKAKGSVHSYGDNF